MAGRAQAPKSVQAHPTELTDRLKRACSVRDGETIGSTPQISSPADKTQVPANSINPTVVSGLGEASLTAKRAGR